MSNSIYGVLNWHTNTPLFVRMITDHAKDIHLRLSDALKWLVQEHIPARGQGYTVKLEARSIIRTMHVRLSIYSTACTAINCASHM